MPSKTQKELALLVTGRDVSATKTLRKTQREIVNLEKRAGQAATNMGRNIERGVMIGGAAVVGAVGYAVKAAGDFEAQLNTINTVARATPEQLAEIGNGIRALSRETGIATEDLTTAYYDLVSAGIDAGQAQGVLNAASQLAIGGLATQAETVDILTTALNSYGVSQQDQAAKAQQFSDVFAAAIERGKLTASDIAGSFSQMGSLAATYGIEIEEIGAAYAQMTAKGVPASEAMTQMNSAVVALLKRSSGLKKLEKQTGKSYLAIAGEQGLVGALQQLREDADKAGVPIMDLVGRKEALNFILATTGDNLEGYNANLAAMGDSAGTAAEQMSTRQQGLNHQLALLKANVHDAALTIGSELLPEFTALAQEGVGWLQDHQPEIKAFAKDLAVGVRDTVKWARSLDWGAITATLKAGATFGKTIVEAFVSAPPWVQQFLAAGFVANKFTGGVLGDVVGELGKGLIKGVLGMNAGVVNINAGVVNGAGGPAGAAGAGGGLLKGLLRTGMIAGGVFGLTQSNAGTQGALGAAGNMASGGLAGAAFGPLGMLAGILGGGVKSVAEDQSARTANQAGAIKQGLDQSIAGKTLPELRTALAGVNQGISDIESNPLMTLLHGDALNTLKTMQSQLETQIGQANTSAARSLEERDAIAATRESVIASGLAAQRAGDKAEAAMQASSVRVGDKLAGVQAEIMSAKAADDFNAKMIAVGQTRAAGEQRQATAAASVREVAATRGAEGAARVAGLVAAAAQRAAAAQIVSAIRTYRAQVNVSPTTIQRITVKQSSTGSSNSSANGGDREHY
jgi:TP901 family phage tail tape measure protein